MLLRRLMWKGLYAGIAAGATIVARKAAARIWQKTTGERPPDE